jgi:hypothetical protein
VFQFPAGPPPAPSQAGRHRSPPTPGQPRHPHHGPAAAPCGRSGRRLVRYLLAAAGLLTLALVVLPPAPSERPDATAAHRLERLRVEGRGPLSGLGRASLRASAWLAAAAIDRQRALLDPTPLAARTGQPLTRALHAWHQRRNDPLRAAAVAAATALAAAATLARRRRNLAVALGFVLVAAVVVTRPATTLATAGFPGRVAVAAAFRLVRSPGPAPLLGQPSLEADPSLVATQKRIGDAYWTAFVTANVSRADTATPILAQAEPARRASLLQQLQRNLVGGRDGNAGGLQRAVVGLGALAAVAASAVTVSVLTVLASIAQALLFGLCLAAVLLTPLVFDPRAWRALGPGLVAPMLAAVVVLFAAALGSWFVTTTAVTLAAAGEWLLSLLSGSTLAVLAAYLVARTVRRQLARLTTGSPGTKDATVADDGRARRRGHEAA